MTEEINMLNLAAWQPRSVANGPGERFVLWVQGCPLRCPGCFNEETHPFVPCTIVEVDEVLQWILATPGIEGVTYTGGEPMLQAHSLAVLSEQLRAKSSLTIVCYTGFTLENLRSRNNPAINRLLKSIDVLIDGPFVQRLAANLMWRGSRNQRVHFLTDAYRHLAEEVNASSSSIELIVGSEHFTATGVWFDGFLHRLKEALEK